ncbi:hypothetical protein HDU96_006748 [Phlyctochytrium bullatum]|nr:hypothetical protein HDU96_006748 [Phlyctochytrium bullatum]
MTEVLAAQATMLKLGTAKPELFLDYFLAQKHFLALVLAQFGGETASTMEVDGSALANALSAYALCRSERPSLVSDSADTLNDLDESAESKNSLDGPESPAAETRADLDMSLSIQDPLAPSVKPSPGPTAFRLAETREPPKKVDFVALMTTVDATTSRDPPYKPAGSEVNSVTVVPVENFDTTTDQDDSLEPDHDATTVCSSSTATAADITHSDQRSAFHELYEDVNGLPVSVQPEEWGLPPPVEFFCDAIEDAIPCMLVGDLITTDVGNANGEATMSTTGLTSIDGNAPLDASRSELAKNSAAPVIDSVSTLPQAQRKAPTKFLEPGDFYCHQEQDYFPCRHEGCAVRYSHRAFTSTPAEDAEPVKDIPNSCDSRSSSTDASSGAVELAAAQPQAQNETQHTVLHPVDFYCYKANEFLPCRHMGCSVRYSYRKVTPITTKSAMSVHENPADNKLTAITRSSTSPALAAIPVQVERAATQNQVHNSVSAPSQRKLRESCTQCRYPGCTLKQGHWGEETL